MEAPSVHVQPTQRIVLNASAKAALPGQKNCLAQLDQIHRLHDSELNYDLHQHNLSMQMLRNREGIAAPLKIAMELHSARKIGRLPFLQSSRMMEDVLLGRDEMIGFNDFLSTPENNEFMSHPHVVVEKSMGIY